MLKRLAIIPAALGLALAWNEPSIGAGAFGRTDLVDASTAIPALRVDLKYATSDNFLHRNVYGDLDRCFLHKEAAGMLAKADHFLQAEHPKYRLHVFDCARPRRVQREMWAIVKGTAQEPYVANPNDKTGSIHNYGGAVDLTIDDAAGKALDMGTPFDFFGDLAHIDAEQALIKRGRLTKVQVANRALLRQVMMRAGFQPLAVEWWHFNSASPNETRRRYRIIE
ncbi:MAG: peptidase vanX D-ala-D-ala dipeptidase [Cyanobacteria bacterium RYN_339]|nr:peptidase vanX D-ala-D-ala dipeptidase [Cyanobacteria bacterium RYN_339]